MLISLTSIALMMTAQANANVPVPRERLPSTAGQQYRLPSTAARDVRDVRENIRRERRSGALSKKQAREMRRDADYIDTLAERYASDGLSEQEARELDIRARVLREVTVNQRRINEGRR